MKILALDGTFGSKYQELIDVLLSQFVTHDIEVVHIESQQIAYCTGCWSCWLKTPGLCVHNDDTQTVLRKAINSDMVIIFTENSVGYMTSNSKKVLEKFIPLVHPYIELVEGECHHIRRYDKYPKLGLIYIDDSINKKDYELTKHMVERAALNFKTTLDISLHASSDPQTFKAALEKEVSSNDYFSI